MKKSAWIWVKTLILVLVLAFTSNAVFSQITYTNSEIAKEKDVLRFQKALSQAEKNLKAYIEVKRGTVTAKIVYKSDNFAVSSVDYKNHETLDYNLVGYMVFARNKRTGEETVNGFIKANSSIPCTLEYVEYNHVSYNKKGEITGGNEIYWFSDESIGIHTKDFFKIRSLKE